MDVSIPKKYHSKVSHHNLPLLPETRTIRYKDLSPTSQRLLVSKLGKNAAKNYKSVKLVSSFLPKKKMVVHYALLKQALENGAQIDHIYRVCRFNQKKFSKEFLDFMTERLYFIIRFYSIQKSNFGLICLGGKIRLQKWPKLSVKM